MLLRIVLLLLSLPGLLSGLQSPLLSRLWRQAQQRLPDAERAALHLELSGIDELEMRLRSADRDTADRLSLEVRDRFREVLSRYRLSSPLPGAQEGMPAWNEVALESTWCREVWSRARQLPFSDEQLEQLLYQLREHEGMERELKGDPTLADERLLALKDHRELVLSQLSRETHQLVRHMAALHTPRHDTGQTQEDTDVSETELSQLAELLGKQRELEEWSLRGRPLPDTFHQVVLHNAQKVHQLSSSLSARQRREEL